MVGTFRIPTGFRLSGVHCGTKSNPQKPDLSLIVSDSPSVAAGVYTQNVVFAAPVAFDRARTPADGIRLVVANSGNANSCTGERGDRDCAEMARQACEACGVPADTALVLSTGLIGEFLPMEKIAAGIRAAADQLERSDEALIAAAKGILTTDTVPKLSARTLDVEGTPVQITGIAKGAAMIGPRMATMLAVILTDATLASSVAQEALGEAVDESFNSISVEGHASTNDTVLLLANGSAGAAALADETLTKFRTDLVEVCQDLARAIVADGEGASHLITIDVAGCASRADAHRIAKTVAESALVKTAIAGADPNWGRIVSAAGYAGVPFDPNRVRLELNGTLLYDRGAPVDFDAAEVSASIRENRETTISLRFSEGDGHVQFWTTDLTEEYVRLNADYHT